MKIGKLNYSLCRLLTCYGHPWVEGVVGGLMLDRLRGGGCGSWEGALVAPGEGSARARRLAVPGFGGASCRPHQCSEAGAPFFAPVSVLLLAPSLGTIRLGILLFARVQFTGRSHRGVVRRVLGPGLMQRVGLCVSQPQREPAVLVATAAALVHPMGPVETTLLEIGVHSGQSPNKNVSTVGQHLCHRCPTRRDNATSANVTQIPDNEI